MNWISSLVLFTGLFASSAAVANCTSQQINTNLLSLKASSPEGYRVYQADSKSFLDRAWWSDCSDGGFDSMIVAVHETVHHLSHNSYETVSGKKLIYGNDQGLPSPSIIAPQISDEDRFKEIYLVKQEGSQSSATNFSILLDEFNAYTFGLHVANQLKNKDTSFQWRAGALTMLHYVSLYARQLQTSNPSAFARLKADPNLSSLRQLMDQAMSVIQRSCINGTPVSEEDKRTIDQLCSNQGLSAVSAITRTTYSCFRDCGQKTQNQLAPVQSENSGSQSSHLKDSNLKVLRNGNELFLGYGRP